MDAQVGKFFRQFDAHRLDGNKRTPTLFDLAAILC